MAVTELVLEEQTEHPRDPAAKVTGLFLTIDSGFVPNAGEKAEAREYAKVYDLSFLSRNRIRS